VKDEQGSHNKSSAKKREELIIIIVSKTGVSQFCSAAAANTKHTHTNWMVHPSTRQMMSVIVPMVLPIDELFLSSSSPRERRGWKEKRQKLIVSYTAAAAAAANNLIYACTHCTRCVGRTDGRTAVEAAEGVRTSRWQHWSDSYHLSSSDGSGGDGTEKILMGKRRCCVQDADENPLISHPPRAHPCCVLFHARAPLSTPIAPSSSSCVLFRRCPLKWDGKGMDTWDTHTHYAQ